MNTQVQTRPALAGKRILIPVTAPEHAEGAGRGTARVNRGLVFELSIVSQFPGVVYPLSHIALDVVQRKRIGP